jgi:WD40 repeat protein
MHKWWLAFSLVLPAVVSAQNQTATVLTPPLARPAQPAPLRAGAYSPDGSTLVVIGSDTSLYWWNAQSGALLRVVQAPDKFRSLATNGHTLATGHKNGTVRLWSMRDGEVLHTLRSYNSIDAIAVSPDGSTVAAACLLDRNQNARDFSSAILLWDSRSGDLLRGITTRGNVSSLAFAPDGHTLASAAMFITNSGEIRLWNLQNEQDTTGWEVRDGVPFCIVYSPIGSTLLNANAAFTNERMTRGDVRLWNIRTREARILIRDNNAAFTRVAWSPDGKYFAAKASHVEPDFKLSLSETRLYDATGKLQHFLPGDNFVLGPLAFAPDGQTLACANPKADVVLWRWNAEK